MKMIEYMDTYDGGKMTLIKDREYLFIGEKIASMTAGLHLNLDQVKQLKQVLTEYIHWAEKHSLKGEA